MAKRDGLRGGFGVFFDAMTKSAGLRDRNCFFLKKVPFFYCTGKVFLPPRGCLGVGEHTLGHKGKAKLGGVVVVSYTLPPAAGRT